ncbi:hypothetical protein [Enterovibrio norvegicus]|nr:hypothetical protein [Enterovibrio norvegicus]
MLYTLMIDFKGGTYISQGIGSSLANGFESAIDNQAFTDIPDFSSASKEKIKAEAVEDGFIPLEGLKNVYCATCEIDNSLAIFNLIATNET